MKANRRMPNTGDWQGRHDSAIDHPRGPEVALVGMLKGWQAYAESHQARYESAIGDDGVLGDQWRAIGEGIQGLLDGEIGRLDCGTLSTWITATMAECGCEVEAGR